MKVRLKLKPGDRGTKKLVVQYGDKLVCARYRYDAIQKKRLKTVEIVTEESHSERIPRSPLRGLASDYKQIVFRRDGRYPEALLRGSSTSLDSQAWKRRSCVPQNKVE
jgi:hypothetical protein